MKRLLSGKAAVPGREAGGPAVPLVLSSRRDAVECGNGVIWQIKLGRRRRDDPGRVERQGYFPEDSEVIGFSAGG